MKFTDRNIKKHVKDHKEIIDRLKKLLPEMGIHSIDINSNEVFIEYPEENVLRIIDWKDKSSVDIYLSYLYDEDGAHEDEYKKQLEKEQKLQLNNYNKYL